MLSFQVVFDSKLSFDGNMFQFSSKCLGQIRVTFLWRSFWMIFHLHLYGTTNFWTNLWKLTINSDEEEVDIMKATLLVSKNALYLLF